VTVHLIFGNYGDSAFNFCRHSKRSPAGAERQPGQTPPRQITSRILLPLNPGYAMGG
jgi:hypothetical protein